MTTDTIPEVDEACRIIAQHCLDGTQRFEVIRDAVLAYHKRQSQEPQKQCSSLETALADWHKLADQRSEALIKAQQQCEELQANNRYQRGYHDGEESMRPEIAELKRQLELRKRNAVETYEGAEKLAEQASALEKERDALRIMVNEVEVEVEKQIQAKLNQAVRAEKAEQQFEEAAKMSFDLAAEKRSVQEQLTRLQQEVAKLKGNLMVADSLYETFKSQLTRLQQDVKPLLEAFQKVADKIAASSAWENKMLHEALETFLTAHPECKP